MTIAVFAPQSLEVIKEDHNPSFFYQRRSGLLIGESFRHLVVAKARLTEVGTIFRVVHWDMTREISDIELKIGGEKRVHLFDETQVSAIIALLITCQPMGEKGPLLNNGYANLLYMTSCVARVYWSFDTRRWGINACARDDNGWVAGRRAFSPGN